MMQHQKQPLKDGRRTNRAGTVEQQPSHRDNWTCRKYHLFRKPQSIVTYIHLAFASLIIFK